MTPRTKLKPQPVCPAHVICATSPIDSTTNQHPQETSPAPGKCLVAFMLTDEDAALQAIATLEELSAEQQVALQSISTIINNGEPFVDVHELFAHYNVLYFRKLLLPRVEVLWSPRLTL